jgi:hypothetical protein
VICSRTCTLTSVCIQLCDWSTPIHTVASIEESTGRSHQSTYVFTFYISLRKLDFFRCAKIMLVSRNFHWSLVNLLVTIVQSPSQFTAVASFGRVNNQVHNSTWLFNCCDWFEQPGCNSPAFCLWASRPVVLWELQLRFPLSISWLEIARKPTRSVDQFFRVEYLFLAVGHTCCVKTQWVVLGQSVFSPLVFAVKQVAKRAKATKVIFIFSRPVKSKSKPVLKVRRPQLRLVPFRRAVFFWPAITSRASLNMSVSFCSAES